MKIVTPDKLYTLTVKLNPKAKVCTKSDLVKYNKGSPRLVIENTFYNIEDTVAVNELEYYQIYLAALLSTIICVVVCVVISVIVLQTFPSSTQMILASGSTFIICLLRCNSLYRKDQHNVTQYNNSTLRDVTNGL